MFKKSLRYQPVGQLAEIIEEFIRFKRSQGNKYVIEENTLCRFSIFSTNYNFSQKVIPKTMLTNWFKRRPNEKAFTQHGRCSSTHVFLRYVMDYGYKVDLPELPRIAREQYIPYIFTGSEIKAFFKACDSFEDYPGSHRHEIIPVLFRLLYGCGLRASEAAALKMDDVDLQYGVVTIHEPKNGKDRYVPMSTSVAYAMKWFHYHVHPAELKGDSFFFRSKYSEQITRHCIYKWFRLCLQKAGIAHMGKGKGPRGHDLRHSFCVHSLRNLYMSGVDLYCVLPILAAYVGHKSIAATQHYLRLTADMYPDICFRLKEKFGQIIPEIEEVCDYEK